MPDRPGHILIVDDNRLNRMKLAHGLRQEGHTSSEAEDGRQALEMIQTQTFDLVLLDIIMPEMDGYQVLEQMKGDSQPLGLPRGNPWDFPGATPGYSRDCDLGAGRDGQRGQEHQDGSGRLFAQAL